ncbi:MAG: hypothetical protein IPM29_26940 [Planctomycetes bacterium]|nr:hypothetical protein [Planctomycetota bacterium]
MEEQSALLEEMRRAAALWTTLPFAGRVTRLSWSATRMPAPADGPNSAIGVARLDHLDLGTVDTTDGKASELQLQAIGR